MARGGPEGPVRGIRAPHGGDSRDLPRHHRWDFVASRQGSSVDVPGDFRHAEGVDRNDSKAGRGRLKRRDIRVGIVYIEGTNCEEESVAFFRHLGAHAEKVHLKQLTGDVPPTMTRTLDDFDLLMIPGGFADGDYVRAGAIFAARLRSKLSMELKEFVEAGKPLFGVCNGFQVLVEAGLLPALGGTMTETPEALLATNDSGPYECPPSYLRLENSGPRPFTRTFARGPVVTFISAHAGGKL